jgi:hypothetical protein
MRHPSTRYPKLVHLEGILLDQAEALAAQDRRFYSKGRPSSSAVIRKAIEIFFDFSVRYREQLLEKTDNPTTA